MIRPLAAALCVLTLAGGASAQPVQSALAPWFDADGFYNKPETSLARVISEMTACRAEAARLKVVRNTRTNVGSAAAFTANGTYDPLVSGAATGIAAIMFAIQDARYNGSIEQIEFRDCAVALGYRHFRLGERDRARLDGGEDRGFAALVAAAAPAEGRLNEAETERNYYAASLVTRGFDNPQPAAPAEAALAAAPADAGAPAEPLPVAATQPQPVGVVARTGAVALAVPTPGMAIIVASARQQSGSFQIPVQGDTFRFRQVTSEGRFIDLLQPRASFALRSHFKPERRRDPTLAGEFDAPRFSTFLIPAGRYVLSDVGMVNACLGTLTFEVREGDVAYLGDFVLRAPQLPMGTLFNPVGNLNSGIDNRMRSDLRVGIGDELEGARQALQTDTEIKGRLARVSYQNGYRIPCDGRYIGRVANPDWSSIAASQTADFHDALAAAIPTDK